MNDQQRAAMIRPRGKSEAPHMIAAYRAMQMALEALEESRDDVVECLNNAEEKATWSKVRYQSMAQEFRNQVERHDKAITALREALPQPQDHSEQHLNMVQGEWVDLTNNEFETAIRKLRIDETMTLRDWNVGRAVIAKLKEKNTQPVVPQGEPDCSSSSDSEPVAWATAIGNHAHIEWGKERPDYPIRYEIPLYTTPPSVEAMRIETLEKAAKVCESKVNVAEDWDSSYWDAACDTCAAAIRSMK